MYKTTNESQPGRPARQFAAGKEVRIDLTADGGVVLDLASGRCYHINATGSAIFSQLLAGRSVETIAADLDSRYPQDGGRCSGEVLDFVELLIRRGWVIAVPPSK